MNMDYGVTWPSWLTPDGGFGQRFGDAFGDRGGFTPVKTFMYKRGVDLDTAKALASHRAGQVGDWFQTHPGAAPLLVGAGVSIIGGIHQKQAMEEQAALQAQLAQQQMEVDERRATRTQQLLMVGIPTIAIVIGVIAWSRREQ